MAKHDDVLAITRLRHEYAFGIDTRDYELFRSVFLDEITTDFSSYSGNPRATMPADEWVASCARLFDGLDATLHSMMNPIVDVSPDGTNARQRMAMQAAHFLDGTEFTIGGWYDDTLVLTESGWKMSQVTLNVTWRRGDESIMARAVASEGQA